MTFALRLAKEVIKMQQGWRGNAIAHINRTSGFSKTLANSCTDWPLLMTELLSQAAEIGFFQPKLVLINIEILKSAIQTDDSTVSASMYHDNLVWRMIAVYRSCCYYSLGDYSLEIFEDPSAMALVEVGILYTQRDPSFFRPISQGIKRCLAHPRTNEDELLELNQILVAWNYPGSLL
ncbi:hypothetical protein YC2023_065095 [Brassica napus]